MLQRPDVQRVDAMRASVKQFRLAAEELARWGARAEAAKELKDIVERLELLADEAQDLTSASKLCA